MSWPEFISNLGLRGASFPRNTVLTGQDVRPSTIPGGPRADEVFRLRPGTFALERSRYMAGRRGFGYGIGVSGSIHRGQTFCRGWLGEGADGTHTSSVLVACMNRGIIFSRLWRVLGKQGRPLAKLTPTSPSPDVCSSIPTHVKRDHREENRHTSYFCGDKPLGRCTA